MNKTDLVLLDGRVVSAGFVRFDPNTYHFWWDNEDVTNLVTRADKLKYDNFDASKDNERIYRDSYIARTGNSPPPPGNTSVASLFFQGVREDVSNIGTNVAKPLAETAIIFGIAGLVAYFLLKGK